MTGPAGSAGSRGGPEPVADLRAALRGVRALVLDADGVLVMRGAALPGAPEALAQLEERGIPYRVATNISSLHRETLATRFARMGLPIPAERIVTALSATVEDVRRTYPGRPVFVLTHPDGLREFGDLPRLTPEDVDADGATAAAVVFGDADRDLSYENLDRAFRLVRRGAELIAMHRNGWWYTAKGETIDTGSFVAAIEYATGVRARVTGKPGSRDVPDRVRRARRRRGGDRERAAPPRRGGDGGRPCPAGHRGCSPGGPARGPRPVRQDHAGRGGGPARGERPGGRRGDAGRCRGCAHLILRGRAVPPGKRASISL